MTKTNELISRLILELEEMNHLKRVELRAVHHLTSEDMGCEE